MLLGNDIFISIDGTTAAFASTRTNEIQTDNDKTEVTSPATANWKEYLAGRNGWSFTVGWLMCSSTSVLNLLLTGSTVTVKVLARGTTPTVLLEGKAICSTCRGTFTRGTLAQGSFQFTGTGPLEVPGETDTEEEN